MAILDSLTSLAGWSCTVVLTVLIIQFIFFMRPFVFPKLPGIPGPFALPMLGSMIPYIKNGAGSEDVKNVKKYGKVHRIFEGSVESLVISDTEILKTIMVKDFSNFTNHRPMPLRGIMKDSLLDVTEAKWRRLRCLLTPSFTSGKLKKMIPIVDKCIGQLMKNLEIKTGNSEKVELKRFMSAYSMDVIASTAFGLELDSLSDPNNPFILNAKKIFDIAITDPVLLLFVFFPLSHPILKMMGCIMGSRSAYEFYAKFVMRTIKERQVHNLTRQDLLQLMLDAGNHELDAEGKDDLQGVNVDKSDNAKKAMSSGEILAQSLFFFGAGYETTSTTMAFLLYNLARNQECQERVFQEVTKIMNDYKEINYEAISKMFYLEQCIQETLRMFPPGARTDRCGSHDVDINGLHIPAGVAIIIPIYAIHNDPDIWPEPNQFDPDRFTPEAKQQRSPFSHIPFGMGPRQCIGMRLALMEMKLALVKLIHMYKFVDAGIPLDLHADYLLKAKNGIWVIPELR